MNAEDWADLLRTEHHDEADEWDDEEQWDRWAGLSASDVAWKERR